MTLDELHAKLTSTRAKHARSVAASSKMVKGILILCGALVAGAAQFWTWAPSATPATAQIVGICACIAVFVGGLYVARTEDDAADATELATQALDAARASEAEFEQIDELLRDFDRLALTYQICLTLRGAIEQSSIGTVGDTNQLIKSMFDLVLRDLVIAAGFAQADRWTLGIYRAVPSAVNDRVELRCIAHDRAIKCSLEEARVWPEGVGIAGIAYTNAREIVVPDLRAEGMAAVFGPRGLTRKYDAERYVSMVAVPIFVAGQERPWGVVNATSDQANHFAAAGSPGFKTDEPVRMLGAFIALAVANADALGRGQSPPVASMVRPGSGSEQHGG